MLLRLQQAVLGLARNDDDQQAQQDYRQQAQRVTHVVENSAGRLAGLDRADQVGRRGQQHGTEFVDAQRRLVNLEYLRRVVEDFAHVLAHHGVEIGELQQVADHVGARELLDSEFGIAFQHGQQVPFHLGRVGGELVGRGHYHLAVVEDLVEAVLDAANQDYLARGDGDIFARCLCLDQFRYHPVGKRDQLGQGFVDLGDVVADRADRSLGRDHGGDVLVVVVPHRPQAGKGL